ALPPEILRLSLNIVTNSRNVFGLPGGFIVAAALVTACGLAAAIGSQLTWVLFGPSQVQEEALAGSITIAPKRPLGCWYIRSEGNRLSEPNSTGVCFIFPPASRSIFPAYHW